MGIIAALLKIATLQLTVVVMVKVKERELHAEKPVTLAVQWLPS